MDSGSQINKLHYAGFMVYKKINMENNILKVY